LDHTGLQADIFPSIHLVQEFFLLYQIQKKQSL